MRSEEFGSIWRFKYIMREARSWLSWWNRGHSVPLPNRVKRSVFIRYQIPNGIWVETGTHLGHTTRYLSTISEAVFSIEPSPNFSGMAKQRFARNKAIRIIEGTSESEFERVISTSSGKVNFWLDGHYSGGDTFQDSVDTPVRYELDLIASYANNFDAIAVFVDDFRCFGADDPIYRDYPTKDFLIDWARSMDMSWTVEYDIFIATISREND